MAVKYGVGFGYPIYSDPNTVVTPTLSGGSWQAGLPLSNLQTRYLSQVARSTSAALRDTRFNVNLTLQRRIGLLGLAKHNLSSLAKVRWLGTNSDQFYFYYEAGEDIAVKGGTFTRSSSAYYTDQNGVLVSVGNDVLRDAHFLSGKRTVLLESSRTNNLLYSEDMGNAAWSLSGHASVITNNGTCPNGAVTADSLVESDTSSGVERYIEQSISGVANGTTSAYSVYALSYKTRQKIKVSFVQKDNTTVIGAIFDLANGTVVSADAGIIAYIDNSTVGGYGYRRCVIVGSSGTGAGNLRCRVNLVDSGNNLLYTGIVNNGVYLWGHQCEVGYPHCSSYIYTTSATATRANDILTFAGLSPQNAMTIYFKGINLSRGLGGTYWWQMGTSVPGLLLGGDNSSGNYITTRFLDALNNPYDGVGNAAAPGYGDEFEMASQYTTTQTASQYSLNGSAVTGASSSAFTAVNAWGGSNILAMAGCCSSGPGFVAMESMRVCPGIFSMAAMRATVYDSGWLDVWPVVYPAGSLPSDDTRMVTGKYSAEEIAKITNPCHTHIPQSGPYTWKQVNCQISDAGNPNAYVDIGRLVVADLVQPSLTMIQGAKLGISSASSMEEGDGGARFFLDKPRRRRQEFAFDDIPEDEGLAVFYEMFMNLGISGQVWFCHNVQDTYHMLRRSFPGTIKELTGLNYPYGLATGTAFVVEEEIA